MDDHYNQLEKRCPMLGSLIPFKYCMTSGDNSLPCWKITDCWWESFDIVTFLKTTLPEEQCQKILTHQPKSKISRLVELANQSKPGNKQ